MDRTTSVYLDLVRFLMATVVLLHHLGEPRVGGGWVHFPQFGPDAVIAFFVLSGFVISYSVRREPTLRGYFYARIARLWSVLVPALALTFCADWIGRQIDPSIYNSPLMGWDEPIVRVVTALSFTNELWFTSITPFSNIPVWSLGFEFWYYVIFGLWFYLNTNRWLFTAIAAAIAGPKILLLMPIWLVGVWLYDQPPRLSRNAGLVLWTISILLYLPLHSLLAEPLRQIGNHWLGQNKDGFADSFLWDYILTLLVAGNFIGFMAAKDAFSGLMLRIKPQVTRFAGCTLSLYLLHFPILLMISAMIHSVPVGPLRSLIVAITTVTICLAIGCLLEPNRFALKALLAGSEDKRLNSA